MIVYAIVILVILFLRFKLDSNLVGKPGYAIETKYLKIVCGILVFLAGIRGSEVGADTVGYIMDYTNDRSLSLAQVIQSHGSIGGGYFFFAKLFSMTGLSVHWWFAVAELFYVYAIYQFVQKFSQDKLISILCFFTMGLFSFSLAGLKQAMSMGFATLAFVSLRDKRYAMAMILGILSYWCHTAAAIFAFGLVCYYLRKRRFYYFYLVIFFVAVILWGDWLWTNSIQLLNDEHYTELYIESDNKYSSWTFVFYMLLLSLMAVPWRRYSIKNSDECKTLYGMTLIATAFQFLATSFSTAFRVAYYFLPFMIVLVPNCCNYLKNDKRLWKIGLCVICIFWCLYTGRENQFTFFWND